VTARPAFGDFLTAARDHATVAAARPETDRGGNHIKEVTDSLLHVITVLDRYLHDITQVPGDERSPAEPPMTAWGAARINARDAVANAAGHLRQHTTGKRAAGVTARSELARRLDATAVTLTAGRDLLHTHLARDPHGARQYRSEWAPVICSPQAEQALLAELAALARQITPPCIDLATSSGTPDTADARRGLHRACGWLQVLNACVQTAQRTDPVTAADRDLLHAIPVNAPIPRPILDGTEPITGLYDAVITSADRARHAAWATSNQPAWSPHLTADSLRQVAATTTVTSHHCQILLRTLAARTTDNSPGLTDRLLRAADAAGRARDNWLNLAQALNNIDTDTMRHLSPTNGEPADLALCTGRLAYADPTWTLSSGPGRQPRPPAGLAPHPADLPLALAAAHHACDAVTTLAYTQRERIRTAARAYRLLVPTRSLPDTMDIPRPYAPAPRDRVYELLSLCQDAAAPAAEASAHAGAAAAALRAPSYVLTTARAAANATRDTSPGRSTAGDPAFDLQPRELTGAVQNTLHGLGITSPRLLQRAADLDQATEQLIIHAAEQRGLHHNPPSPITPTTSASSPALTHSSSYQPEPPEAEP
jgi:hypothetical protein